MRCAKPRCLQDGTVVHSEMSECVQHYLAIEASSPRSVCCTLSITIIPGTGSSATLPGTGLVVHTIIHL